MREGDQNTKFFHAATKNRRITNQIKVLKNEDDNSVEWGSGLEETMINYFTKLFSATNTDWGPVVDCVQQKVTNAQNEALLADIDPEEV